MSLLSLDRGTKETLPAPPNRPSPSPTMEGGGGGGGGTRSAEISKANEASGAAVICGEGGVYYDARSNLEDDGGFSTFCLMVDRVKTNVEVSRLEAAVAVGGKETLVSGHPIRG